MKPNRRPCENIEVTEYENINGVEVAHTFLVRVDYHPKTGVPMGAFIASRGKEGHLIDRLLYKTGIALSRLIQHR